VTDRADLLGLRTQRMSDPPDPQLRGDARGQMQEFPTVGKFHFVLHHCNSHNDLHCLPALNGATGSLGNFPQCLIARAALTAWLSPPSTTTRAFVLLCGRRIRTRSCAADRKRKRRQLERDRC
jgi:hypothetical protein